jgi:membrane protease YdiL (CAAX protease family)
MPAIQQGWTRAIVFFAVYVGAIIATAMAIAWGLIAAGVTDEKARATQAIEWTSVPAISVVTIALSLVFRRFIDKQPLLSLGFSLRRIGRELAMGFLLSIVLIGSGVLILQANGNLQWVDGNFKAGQFLLLLLSMLLLVVGEEMAFRGYILNNLMESLDRRLALAASAALFAMVHLFNPGVNALAVVNVFLGGILLGLNYIYTRQLWFAIALHAGWNFLQGPVFGFSVSGLGHYSILEQERKGNPLLTGGQFGFEGSIIATILLLAAIIVLYFVYENNEPPN